MSRVKLWIGILAVMVLALGASPAPAAQLSLEMDHDISVALTPLFGGAALAPSGGYIYSNVYGGAAYPSESPPSVANNQNLTIGTWASAPSALTSGSWLNTTSNTVTYTVPGFTINQLLKGNAPAASVPDAYNGNLYQGNSYAYNIHLDYTITTPGWYLAAVTDVYDLIYKLVGNTESGGANYFYSTSGDASLQAYFSAPGSGWLSGGTILLDDTRSGVPSGAAVPVFTVSNLNQTAGLSIPLNILAGGTASFDLLVYGYQQGDSNNHGVPPVPLPSTLLLLGFGLVGLAGLGRRYKFKKS